MNLQKAAYLILVLIFFGSCKTKEKTAKVVPTTSNESIEFANHYYNASKEKLLGNVQQAAALYAKCILLSPSNPAPKYELASIYAGTNRLEDAELFAKQAFNLESKNVWYALLYARILEKKNDYNQSAKILEKTAKLNPTNLEVLFEHASVLLMAGKFNDAIKVYDQIEEQSGVSEELAMQKQKIYLKLNKLDKAAEELEKLIKSNPSEAHYYGMLAELYSTNGQSKKALETFNKILEVDPSNGYVHLSLADYYRSAGDKNKSFEELKMAFDNAEVDIDTKVRILLSYYNITETDATLKPQAFELLDKMVKIHEGDAKSHSVNGDFLYREKKLIEARDAYKKAVALDAEKFVIWNQLLLIDTEIPDYDDLYESGKQAVELFPSQANVFLLHALACMQKKLYSEALLSLKSGVALVIDNAPLESQFYSYMGDCFHAIKDYKSSDESYEKALKADPKNIYVLNNYAYYLSLRSENLNRAEQMAKQVLEIEPNTANYEDTYAWVLFKMKNYQGALDWLLKALEHGGGGNATIIEHIGDCYILLGKTEQALEYWNKAQLKEPKKLLEKKIMDKKYYEE